MATLSPSVSVLEMDINVKAPSNNCLVSNDLSVVGDFTMNDANCISNISTIEFQTIDGDIVDRFENAADHIKLWSDPLLYRSEILNNGNNIRHVINPTKDDYLFSIEHGARPEFIDFKVVTLDELQKYIDDNPVKFV